jgi:hypothetical protein
VLEVQGQVGDVPLSLDDEFKQSRRVNETIELRRLRKEREEMTMDKSTRKILVPVERGPGVTSIPGNSTVRFDTKLVFPGRPLRLVVPAYMAVEYVIGDIGVVRGGGDLERSPSWPLGNTVPALVWSEAFKELDFELDLPVLRAGDAVSFSATNVCPASRWFSAGWLIESMER